MCVREGRALEVRILGIYVFEVLKKFKAAYMECDVTENIYRRESLWLVSFWVLIEDRPSGEGLEAFGRKRTASRRDFAV